MPETLALIPFERSGLACGFGHGRFACGNLQASGPPLQSAIDIDSANVALRESVSFSSSYDSNSIAVSRAVTFLQTAQSKAPRHEPVPLGEFCQPGCFR